MSPDLRIYGLLSVVVSFLVTGYNAPIGAALAILGLIMIIVGFVGHSRYRSR